MSYITFDKTQLINLEYSLNKEFIRSNRAGSFANSTIINCNTRKYHGLLICPLPDLDGGNHVFLSTLDETIIQRDKEFHLSVHKYPGIYSPGHKYIRDFQAEPIPQITYRVGGVILLKEMLLVQKEERILIKYTLLNANSPTKIRLHPFLAFRNVHALSKANLDINPKYTEIKNGVKIKLYDSYPYLHMQTSKKCDYTPAPNWFYNIEYTEEQLRGYDFREDLFVQGFFELSLKKGESIIFSAGLTEAKTKSLKTKFISELKKRTPRADFESCLKNSAQQFIIKNDRKSEVIAGFPWFGRWGRDTFISLPGLTLAYNDLSTFKSVLDTMSEELKDGLFKNMGGHSDADVNSVDAPLWFFWAIQQYTIHTKNYKSVWTQYGTKMQQILNAYIKGTQYNIKMHDNGLIYAGIEHKALTWMDAIVNGKPVTPRIGYNVEINALWYNAICFVVELAKKNKDSKTIKKWKKYPQLIKQSFIDTFWNSKKAYLADYVNGDYKDWAVRPNQIIACSLEHSPIDIHMKKAVIDKVKSELLTPKGLRTLSPKHLDYKGVYSGNQEKRDSSYHQGIAWVWLLGHFCESYLKLHEKSGVNFIKKIYNGFEEEMTNRGIGTISEIYDGNPPYTARGAISQAWSVSELIRIKYLIDKYENI